MALYNIRTIKEFDEKVLKSKKVVLVDFWANWCPPCVAMAPTLHTVASTMDENVDIVKVNIEESPENAGLASQYQVMSIPNMNVFKDGKVVDTIVGLVPQRTLEDTLSRHI